MATTTGPAQKQDMTVAEYADWWRDFHNSKHNNPEEESGEEQQSLLYLKDWKFVANHYNSNNKNNNQNYYINDAYEWPIYFRDDWLNGPEGAMGSAYRFIYLGPKGTTTKFHADVLRSFSWSTNVAGRKEWWLVPPQYTYLLQDVFGGKSSLAPHIHDSRHFLYPGLKLVQQFAYRVIQEADETLFVPSEWHHCVENLAPTLSINHNWLNGANIKWGWNKLRREIQILKQQQQQQQQLQQQQT
jgi:hypothetical protein